VIDVTRLREALTDPRRREDVFRELLAFYRQVLPMIWRSADSDSGAEDAIQQTMLNVWQRLRAGHEIPNEAYLRTMLANKLAENYRRATRAGRRMVPLDETALARLPGPPPDIAISSDAATARRAFDRMLERAIVDRAPRYREQLRADGEQLWRLATAAVAMSSLIDEESGGSTEEVARKQAQDRLFKRHERARSVLEEARAVLVEAGEISSADGDFYRMVLRHLLRCQTRARGASRDRV
jgi:DNA-directed RNA polymerase specialized sigma24 family protein